MQSVGGYGKLPIKRPLTDRSSTTTTTTITTEASVQQTDGTINAWL
jgi:hypothetical protein